MNPFGQTFHLEYDLEGKNTLVTQRNGVREEKSYTARDWLASILVRQQNASVLDTLNYYYTDASNVYDPTGHLRREVDAGNRTHAFFYDNLYELVQETHPDFGTNSYSYDPNSNRASKTTSLGTDYYGVDANNKLLWVNRGTNAAPTHLQANPYTLFTYDACGRTTYRERQFDGGWHRDFSFFWDGDDRLRSVKNGTDTWLSASYDGDGTRVSKTDFWTGAHNYSWGAGGIVADSNSSTTYTPGFAQRQGSTDRFSHDDWLGSSRYLSDSTGNAFPSALRFDAFGNRSATGGTDAFDPTEFQFAGGAGYETEYASGTEPGIGLQLLGQRYYDPAIGRFISQDPIGFAGGLNLYGYCGNDPVGLLDPLGLISLRTLSGLGGAAVASFAGPELAAFGYLAGTAFYDAVGHLGSVVGCHDAGQASGWEVAKAGAGVGVGAAAIVPGLDLGAIVEGIGPLRAIAESTQEASVIRKIQNAIAKNARLGPNGEVQGAIRDLLGNPVPKPAGLGGFYNHLQELDEAMRGLEKNAELLNGSTNPAAQAARQQALQHLDKIWEALGKGLYP